MDNQVDLDEIHEYNQSSRKAFNKRFTTIENKIKEQDVKLDKILKLLEEKLRSKFYALKILGFLGIINKKILK